MTVEVNQLLPTGLFKVKPFEEIPRMVRQCIGINEAARRVGMFWVIGNEMPEGWDRAANEDSYASL